MRRATGLASIGTLVRVVLLVTGCAAAWAQTREEVLAALRVHADSITRHKAEEFGESLTDDFVSDNVSAQPRSKSDTVAAIAGMIKGAPTLGNFQGMLLLAGNFAVFDECSFVMQNPKTGRQYRIFHMDIVELRGTKVKVMTTFGDSAAGSVALGMVEPPIPAPPPRSARVYPTPAPQPTYLAPLAAQAEALSRWNRHDLTAMATMLAQDADIMISPLLDEVDREAYVAWQEVFFAAFPDLTLTPIRSFDMGDGWVVSELQMTGTHRGAYLGHAATWKPIRMRVGYLARYRDGLVTNLKLYMDSLSLLKQIGFEPAARVAAN
jgi:hypothetical protein